MKLNLHPKGIPKQEPLGADTPLKKGGVVVGMRKEGDKEKIYFVGDDCHLLCVGATRSGKSRCLVLESICLLGLAGESIFCSDPKAELFHYTADFLKKLGYEVLVLDFKNPEKSMRYNLLQPIIDAISEGDTDRAEMLAWDLTNNLVGKPEGEKIWTNGECSIIAAAILCVVCDNQKRPEFQNLQPQVVCAGRLSCRAQRRHLGGVRHCPCAFQFRTARPVWSGAVCRRCCHGIQPGFPDFRAGRRCSR